MAQIVRLRRSTCEDERVLAAFIESLHGLCPSSSQNDLCDPSSLHLWLIDQTAEEFLAVADRVPPSPEDEARAARLESKASRRRFLAQRAALRLILARRLGRPAEKVRLIRLPGGKPALVPHPGDPPLGFSLSHSRDVLAIAVGAGVSLGIDIETPRAMSHASAIAARWFLPAERAALDALSPGAAEHGFFVLWTAKEALAKRHGAGLRLMREDAEELAVAPHFQAGRLKAFRARSGEIGALASSAPVSAIHLGEDLMSLVAAR